MGYASEIYTSRVYQNKWPQLSAYAKFILTIPATSAPVERVFSVGVGILALSRRRLGDQLFEKLLFLKCNVSLFEKKNFIPKNKDSSLI